MKKMLRAVVAAMLFATGAQAATVDGLFPMGGGAKVSNPVAGQMYRFDITLDAADLLPLPGGATPASVVGSTLFVTIKGQGINERKSAQPGGPLGLTYSYLWQWQSSGPTDFQFLEGVLYRYFSGTPTGTVVNNGTTGPFSSNSFYTQPIKFNTTFRLASANPTPVPIGGTLPLMLSAIGLGALVMRRRAKKAALA